MAEINATLELLQSEGTCRPETLAELQDVHELFLSHFEDGGPILR